MPPTLGPDLAPASSLPKFRPAGRPLNRSSTSSSRSLPDNPSIATSPAYSTSSLSIPFEHADVDVVRVEGLRHANVRLEARRYKTLPFAEQLLRVLHTIRAPSWSEPEITPDAITIQKVSGSLTNAVFFVSCPPVANARTVLLRVYGPSSGSLISRPRELHTLHVLSSRYHIGPRVYGTFENGRVEEYFDSTALTAADLRDQQISAWIGARMAELHGVDIDAVEPDARVADGPEKGQVQLGVQKNVKSWLPSAREVLNLPGAPAEVRAGLDLDRFEREWGMYLSWLHQKEASEGMSPRVFSHNDAQYGNLLRLRTLKEGEPAHRQIIVVDFEYASPNPAAFDIANHFHEWTADYHGPTPHLLDASRYPTPEQRRNFYRAYLLARAQSQSSSTSTFEPAAPAMSDAALEAAMAELEAQVRTWSPASHAMWAVWGVVQAREFVEGQDGEPEFDYLGYAQCRMDGFREGDARARDPAIPAVICLFLSPSPPPPCAVRRVLLRLACGGFAPSFRGTRGTFCAPSCQSEPTCRLAAG
ncbi:kinase-like protein [Trametes sanguinea]|nr:kinase-like protein [Trametes sanguinea]